MWNLQNKVNFLSIPKSEIRWLKLEPNLPRSRIIFCTQYNSRLMKFFCPQCEQRGSKYSTSPVISEKVHQFLLFDLVYSKIKMTRISNPAKRKLVLHDDKIMFWFCQNVRFKSNEFSQEEKYSHFCYTFSNISTTNHHLPLLISIFPSYSDLQFSLRIS